MEAILADAQLLTLLFPLFFELKFVGIGHTAESEHVGAAAFHFRTYERRRPSTSCRDPRARHPSVSGRSATTCCSGSMRNSDLTTLRLYSEFSFNTPPGVSYAVHHRSELLTEPSHVIILIRQQVCISFASFAVADRTLTVRRIVQLIIDFNDLVVTEYRSRVLHALRRHAVEVDDLRFHQWEQGFS
jgi:hypothetical protein